MGAQSITNFNGLSLGGSAATNYTRSGASGSVTITGAPLTITANARVKTYGTTLSLGTTAFTVGSGLQGTETVTAVTLFANGGTPTNSPVSGSPYTITPSAAVGANGFLAANYNITYVPNSLTVNPLPVVLTGTRAYDGTTTATNTILTVTNALGGDVVNAASGSATLASPHVGPEAITAPGTLNLGGASAGNYTVVGLSGTVTITGTTLTITASPQSKTFGSTISPSSAFIVGPGLGNGQSVTSVTLTANGGTAANSPVSGSLIQLRRARPLERADSRPATTVMPRHRRH